MRDFFEAQKHIIIALIVVIAITIISGFYASPQSLPIKEEVNKIPSPIEPTSSDQIENVEKENNSLLQEIIPEVPVASGEEAKDAAETGVAKKSQASQISASLVINGKIYSLLLPENSSAYDLMLFARKAHGISFGGKEYSGLGFFIDEINGVKNNQGGNKKFWIYSVNGKKADVGVSQYRVKKGDIISWSYEDEE